MYQTMLLTFVVSGGVSQSLPDQLDILRGTDRTPQLKLLIDMSGSMLNGDTYSPCDWFLNELGRSSNAKLDRIEQVVAVLTGCRSDSDGIIDRWSSQVVFAIDGYSEPPDQGFKHIYPFPTDDLHYESNGSALEEAIRRIPGTIDSNAGTPLAEGYRRATENFNDVLSNINTRPCRGNAIIVMTDGAGNYEMDTQFSWIPGHDLTVRDDGGCFCAADPDQTDPNISCPDTDTDPDTDRCRSDFVPPHLHHGSYYVFGDPATGLHDALQHVDGVQPIRTYTISFNAPLSSRALLEEMAIQGGGEHFEADNYEQLSTAFNSAIYRVNSNADASFQGISVQTAGLFTGNFVYQNLVQGAGRNGYWFGNIKKYCLFPESSSDRCFLKPGPTSGEWILNEEPADMWSSSKTKQTREGGAGQKILSALANENVATPPQEIVQAPPAGRKILTWELDDAGYLELTSPLLTATKSFSLDAFHHFALINQLYGYTFDAVNITNSSPTRFDRWPLADTMNGGQTLLKYSENCESSSDRCYFISVSNAGMLHVFDAFSGAEKEAIIPPHFWRPNGVVHNKLGDLLDQPTPLFTRRFYFDGGLSLFHLDENRNGYIDGQEKAELVTGFGRGGAGYIKWDVSKLGTHAGALHMISVAPKSLVMDQTSGFKHLRDTWAAPWLGLMETAAGGDVQERRVAIFPSGHMPELDAPSAPFAELTIENTAPANDNEESYYSIDCMGFGVPTQQCSLLSVQTACSELGIGSCTTGSSCSPCNDVNTPACAGAPCYNWPDFDVYDLQALSGYGVTQVSPLLLVNIGPFGWTDGVSSGLAYRIHFSRVSLQPNDHIDLLDGSGSPVQRISGPVEGAFVSNWIYSPSWRLRFTTNGEDDAEAYGYEIDKIDIQRDVVPTEPFEVLPSVYVVDLEDWNGDRAWQAIPAPDDSSQADSILIRFTSDCSGVDHGENEICIDKLSSPETKDLRFMRCPISAAPAVYAEAGILKRIYIADECGQIWSISQNRERTEWQVKRLLSTNQTDLSGAVVAGRESRNYRKIFGKLDIVLSTCTGRRAVGVYFGTGNIQRPAAIPGGNFSPGSVARNLQDAEITGFSNASFDRDIIGVVWDAPDVPPGGYTLDELVNVSSVVKINPKLAENRKGMFIELAQEEKALRPPLVFLGVANFQTYRPVSAAGECEDAVGSSYMYQLDNCTGAPVTVNAAMPSDRKRLLNAESLIGGGLLLVADKNKKPVILAGDAKSGAAASVSHFVDETLTHPGLRLYLWRTDVD